MLTIKQIRDDKQAAIRKLAKKGVDAAPVIARIETLDDRRKAIQTELDNTLAAQNKAAKEIGALMGQGRRDEAEERKRFVADLKEKSNRLQAESHDVQEELQAAIVSLPNFPADIVPEGKTAEDNLVVKLVESYTQLPENPLPHWELARKYDIIDFDLGVKLTGAGFPVYKGKDIELYGPEDGLTNISYGQFIMLQTWQQRMRQDFFEALDNFLSIIWKDGSFSIREDGDPAWFRNVEPIVT